MESKLTDEEFLAIVRTTPLVSIDLVARNPQGEVLVGLRANEPAKGFWFVPGGRIHKGERVEDAFARIVRREMGCAIPFADARFLGVFQHFYDTNFAEQPGIATHYVSLGHAIELTSGVEIRGDAQHEELKWFSVDRALADDRVHAYAKELISAACVPSRGG
jgi:colanic acid biosynthesis protein WcaH